MRDTDGDGKPDAPMIGHTHLDKWNSFHKGFKPRDGVCKGHWIKHRAWQFVILIPLGAPPYLLPHEEEHVELTKKVMEAENKKNEAEKKDVPESERDARKTEAIARFNSENAKAQTAFDKKTGHGTKKPKK